MYSPPKPAPHTWFAEVCESTDRYSRPPLRRRLAPLGLLVMQLVNAFIVGSLLLGLGWLMLMAFHSGDQPFCIIYLAGALYGVCFSLLYVALQSLHVLFKNFIWPS